jgi:hypothetical protein
MQLTRKSGFIPKYIHWTYKVTVDLIIGTVAAALILVVVLAGALFRLVAGQVESFSQPIQNTNHPE